LRAYSAKASALRRRFTISTSPQLNIQSQYIKNGKETNPVARANSDSTETANNAKGPQESRPKTGQNCMESGTEEFLTANAS
jgi:hypothetical protein